MMKLLKRILPLAILGLAIVVFIYMKNTKPEQPPVEVKEKVWMVNAQQVALETLPAVQTLYGVVESNAMVDAAAPISSVVSEVNVLPGDAIKKGQILVKLSEEDLALPVAQANADYEDAKSQIALQKMTMKANETRLTHEKKVLVLKQEALQRAKTLMAKNLASQSAVDTAKEALVKQEYAVVGVELLVEQGANQLAQLQARLQKAQAALAQAKLNQSRGVVVAPFNGRVANLAVAEGDRVNAGAVLVSFYALESMELKTKLDTQSFEAAQKAITENVSLQADYYFSEGEAKLTLKRLAGEAQTSGVDAYFSLPKSLYFKRPGELLEVYFKGQAAQNVAVVPYSAVYGNDRVYLIENGRLKSQKIELKGDVMRDGKLMALISHSQGLPAGKKVLITHLPNAIDGLRVTEVKE